VSLPPPPRRRSRRPPHPDLEPAGEAAVPIGQAVDHLLSARGLRAAGSLAAVLGEWEAIVGAEIARHVVPSAFRDGELIVDVDSPAWSTEVQFQEALILTRCREQLGESAPARLRVRVRRPGSLPPQGL
jgi:predicted nucleic acid-binding Zn ribbon protein